MKIDHLTLCDLASIFKKRLVPILLAALLFAVVGFSLGALLPPKYSATASFYTRNLQSEAFLEANGLTSSQLASVQTLAKEYAALTEESDELLDRMITRHGLSLSPAELRSMLSTKTESTVFYVSATAADAAVADAVIAAVYAELPSLIQEIAWPNLLHRDYVVVPLQAAEPAVRATLHPVAVGGLSLIAGLLLSYLFFVFYFLFSNRVTDKAELERVLPGVSVLGDIPHIAPPADAAEPFYALRERLPRPKGKAVTVALTSAMAGEGKSYVAQELAKSLATAGRRVLLVDADLRRGEKEPFFAADRAPGLAEYLGGGVDALRALLHQTEQTGLSLLPAGALPISPCDTPFGARMAALLDAFCIQYDYIIADFPAVSEAADAAACVRDFENTLLVAAPPRCGARELRATVDAIAAAGGKLLGVVANKPSKNGKISKIHPKGEEV